MIAGLPESSSVMICTVLALGILSMVAVSQEVQTPPVVIDPGIDPINEQTPADVLQPIYDFVDLCVAAADADKVLLKTAFESVVSGGLLTVDQALGMLEIVGWDGFADPEMIASAIGVIGSVLDDLIAGVLLDDPIVALTLLWNQALTPAGTLNAIGNAGASDAVLAEVSSLVAGGVPPGILVRLTKEALRLGLTEEEILARIEQLGDVNPEEVSWGNLANDISGKGENKHQEAESEQNINTEGNEAPEEENNANSNGKKDDNPGKGNEKGKKSKKNG